MFFLILPSARMGRSGRGAGLDLWFGMPFDRLKAVGLSHGPPSRMKLTDTWRGRRVDFIKTGLLKFGDQRVEENEGPCDSKE